MAQRPFVIPAKAEIQNRRWADFSMCSFKLLVKRVDLLELAVDDRHRV